MCATQLSVSDSGPLTPLPRAHVYEETKATPYESTTETQTTTAMLDINDFITERGGNPDLIRKSQEKRYAPVEAVDEVIVLFEDHKRTAYAATQINAKINGVKKQIGAKMKAKEDAADLLQEKARFENEKKDLLDAAAEKEKVLKAKVKTIGNLVHDSVPVSDNEDNNVVERTWAPEGVTFEKRNVLSHHEVLAKIEGYDAERGTKVVGHRGYFLKKWGVFLNQAIINYGLEFLDNKGYTALQTPQLMLKEQMAKTAQLSQFDEELYKVTGDQADKYLIATSEQPISAFHSEEWLQAKELPLKYAGYSTCFRKEAGKHGRDVWGIFRVHEFTKVEQFCLTEPEKSWEMFETMIATSEEFYKSLGIPYRVVAIVSGALNNAAAKKLDLEAWFPHQGEFKELVSCSNCTDYQSRDLEIRYGVKKQTDVKKTYVHCLNSTLTATTRTICAILENFQTDEGVKIPEPLRKYLPGAPDFLPYPVKQEEEKKDKKDNKKDIPVR
ncbi:serine--tRNA ligase, cytoplasmic [Rhypophila decipiens]